MSTKDKLLIERLKQNKLAAIEYIISWGLDNFIPYGKPHKHVIDVCEKIRQQKELVAKGKLDPKQVKDGVIIQFCRNHGKTSIILGYILTLLGENPNLRVKIICESEQLAKQRIKFLKTHIERNPRLKKLYPHLEPAETESWSSQQIYVKRSLVSPDPSVEAYGILSAATGSHCVVEGTPVITSKGLKSIEEIEIGDKVYSITGKFENVVAKMKHNYSGIVYSLVSDCDGSKEVNITSDHKVFVFNKETNDYEWIKAENLYSNSIDYLLAYPLGNNYSNVKFVNIPIKSIKKKYYDGFVYDIQVQNGSSFCSPFVLLKNCELLVCDDIIGQKNAIVYPENLKKVEEAFYNTWLNVLDGKRGWLIYIFTPYRKGELSLKLKEKTDLYEVVEYKVDDKLTPIWPEWMDREDLRKEREKLGATAFARAYQGKVASEEDFVFNSESIKNCYDYSLKFGQTEDDWIFVMGVDLASGKNKSSARNVIFTLGIDKDGNRIPVSIKIGKWDSVTTAKLILAEYQKYQHRLIKIENNAYQQALIDWLSAITKDVDLPIEGYRTGSQKFDPNYGLPSMAAEFERGMWRIPMADEHPEDCKCSLCTWLEELISFPHAKFSDTVMASFFAREAAREVADAKFDIDFINIGVESSYIKESDDIYDVLID